MEQGKCPKCGETNLEYGSTKIDDQQLGYECICHSCDFKGIEWYTLEFNCFTDYEGKEFRKEEEENEKSKCL